MDKKVKGVPGTPHCSPTAAVEEMTTLSSGRDPPPLVPPLTQSKALPLRDWVSRPLCPSPSSYFRMSHLVVLGFLPTSCAVSTQPGCSLPLAPTRHGASPEALCWGSLGARGQVAFSLCLPGSFLLSGWCCPSLPHVFGVCLSFLLFFILKRLARSLPPPLHPPPHCG